MSIIKNIRNSRIIFWLCNIFFVILAIFSLIHLVTNYDKNGFNYHSILPLFSILMLIPILLYNEYKKINLHEIDAEFEKIYSERKEDLKKAIEEEQNNEIKK